MGIYEPRPPAAEAPGIGKQQLNHTPHPEEACLRTEAVYLLPYPGKGPYPGPARAMAATEYAKKVLVIGDASVGKTSFVRRITEGRFIGEYVRDTVGSELKARSIVMISANK